MNARCSICGKAEDVFAFKKGFICRRCLDDIKGHDHKTVENRRLSDHLTHCS
ncbi:MAG: hypothetical protein PUB39_00465 [Eubacteriales bacterium]|nr:hypothetical protein [Eubacteriales bacterium]